MRVYPTWSAQPRNTTQKYRADKLLLYNEIAGISLGLLSELPGIIEPTGCVVNEI
jgi:hypothetical protein